MATTDQLSDRELEEAFAPIEQKYSLKQQYANLPRGKPVRVDMKRFPQAPETYMRPPSGADISGWEQSGVEYGRKGKVSVKVSRTRKAELVVICACDADGKLIWTPADAKAVAGYDADLVNHLFNAARKVSGQDADEDEDEEPEQGN